MTAKAEIRIYLEAQGAGTEKQRLRILGHLDRIAGRVVSAKSAREPEPSRTHPDGSPTTSPFPHVAREERWTDEQIKSFAYGNLKMHNPNITRDDIERAFRDAREEGEGGTAKAYGETA